MAELLLYGLNERGVATHSETLRAPDRASLAAVAKARLTRFHAVEIWEGPMCLIRVRRTPAIQE